jgi:hypothetical protein
MQRERLTRDYWLAIAALSTVVVGWNLYRASNLSITHDEAFTYLWFVAKGPRGIYSPGGYCANNHLLYSLLAWCSVQMLGVSEFALRLPSVVAGGLFVFGAGRLFRGLAGPTMLALSAVLVLTLNPLVMEFLVAARGYGLGLGLSMWAWSSLCATLAPATDPASRKAQISHWLFAGTAMGMAVGANLTVLFPNFALALAYLAVKLGTDRTRPLATLGSFGLCFVLPGVGWAALLCYPIFRHLHGAHFFYGSESFFQVTRSILEPTLQAAPASSWDPIAYGVMFAVIALLAPLLAVLYRLVRHPESRQDEWNRTYAFIAGGTVGVLGLLLLCHGLRGTPLPSDRTGLYFVPLAFALLVLVLGKAQAGSSSLALAARVAPVLLWALAAYSATQMQAEFLYHWRYDAGTKRAFHLIADASATQRRSVRLGYDWYFEPAFEFYRAIAGRETVSMSAYHSADERFDYYFLEATNAQEWEYAGKLRVICADPISGAKLGISIRNDEKP